MRSRKEKTKRTMKNREPRRVVGRKARRRKMMLNHRKNFCVVENPLYIVFIKF